MIDIQYDIHLNYLAYIIDNLITTKIIDSTEWNTWIDITYPNGFNNVNSIVIPIMMGTNPTYAFHFKINDQRTKYTALNFSESSNYRFFLVFIRIR